MLHCNYNSRYQKHAFFKTENETKLEIPHVVKWRKELVAGVLTGLEVWGQWGVCKNIWRKVEVMKLLII
jgi:hypothetical protein